MVRKRRRAQSVLEFLTARNPTITPTGEGKGSNTSRHDYFWPKEVRPWKEFNYKTLETIFGGELLKEAQRKRSSLPHYPHLDELDLALGKDEPSTRSLINKWNHTIVVASLRAVQHTFHPCVWREKLGGKPSKDKPSSTVTRKDPDQQEVWGDDQDVGRECVGDNDRQDTNKTKSKRSRQPDGGSVSVLEMGSKKPGEMFPKEYKPASNWNSKALCNGECTDEETGKWLRGRIGKNANAPIRQAYTYCIDFQCRYGCILTTAEAFIFRIKPRGREEAASPNHDPTSFNRLLNRVKTDGLMEFVSIPWDNGCDDRHHDYQEWTVNLALWFTHILAGNNHQLDWEYLALWEEQLVQTPQQEQPKSGRKRKADISAQGARLQSQNVNARKHLQSEQAEQQTQSQDNHDLPTFSFSGNPVPAQRPDVPTNHYAAGDQDRSDESADEDLDLPPLKRRLRSAMEPV